jgi:hypothetical protein
MTDQNVLFILLFFVFVFLIWGRWRYDLVAFAALLIATIVGVIPVDTASWGLISASWRVLPLFFPPS